MLLGTLIQSIRRCRIAECLAIGLLTAVAGCGSLPIIVPDMGMRSGRAVQLEGAFGPLTPERSKAILDRLKSGSEQTSIFDRHLALQQGIPGIPLVVGNKVVLLQDGAATFQAMLTAIRDAKDHILSLPAPNPA